MRRLICILLSLSLLFSGVQSIERTANLNDTFPTIDGGTVPLKADASKDVTMLIFGRTTCGNSSSILQNIAESGWIQNAKVRVIFAEINKADEQSTKTFARTYGCEEMTFCYDLQGGISSLMWQYLQAGGMGGSVTLPVVVLLDSGNSVRSVLTGYQSSNDLFREMNQFAIISGNASDEEEDIERNVVISGQENYKEAYQVLDIVNQTRAQAGQPALKMDAELLEAAMTRAMEISVFYSHMRPNGKECFSIFRSSSSHGENIALGSMTPEDVMEGWNNSPGHYANIIGANYTSIGIGCFMDSDGTRYWVQCFDNANAADSAKSGTEAVTRTIPVRQSLLRLQTEESYEAGCGSEETDVKMVVRNRNAEWVYGSVEFSPTNFEYTSSNPMAAEADENGTITIKAAGTTVITASLKENPSIKVSMKVTKKAHSYKSTVVAPTLTSQGYTNHVCKSCGDTYQDSYVPIATAIAVKAENVRLAKISVTWNGKEQKPAVTAKDNQGKEIRKADYTVAYSNNKNVGQATVTVAFRNGYTGTVKKTFKILPKGTNLSKLTAKRKGFTVKWKKQKSQTTGYEIQYSTSRRFKGSKMLGSINAKTTSKSVTRLKAKKKYYVRIRTYKTVKIDGKNKKLYSGWSKEKSVTTKK